MKLEGLTTPSMFSIVTETITEVDTSPRPQIEEEVQQADLSTGKDRRKLKTTGVVAFRRI